MYYTGSKARYATEIITITCADRGDRCYVEPFVGGGNVICRVPAEGGPRIGSDVNWRMIELLDAVGNRGWLPPERIISEDEYNKIANNPDTYPPELVAFVATALSYGSMWFGNYVKNVTAKKNKHEKYSLEKYQALGRKRIAEEAPLLHGVKFFALRYQDIAPHVPPQSIIYCDPPYAGTTGYGGAKTDIAVGQDLSLNAWNRAAFWRWADEMVEAGHRVYVSEYAGPPPSLYSKASANREVAAARFRALQADPKSTREERERAAAEMRGVQAEERAEAVRLAARWACVWEKEVVSSFDSGRGTEGKREVERLFHRVP